MEDYNRLISAKVLDGYEAMIDNVPQPQMLGGKRMRKYVLPNSTEYDYPATLSVGRMDGEKPSTLGGDFWKDFGDGFPTGSLQAGSQCGGKVKIGKMLKPLAPVAKELGMTLAKEGIKEGVKSYAKSGGRRKKGVGKALGKAFKSVGKELAPVAKEVFHDVIVPEGKKALRDYIRDSLKAKPSESASSDEMIVGKGRKPRGRKVGTDPRTYTPQHLLAEGGALIRDVPDQFHSSVYPPALASYAHSFPAGHDAYGRGRAKLPKSGSKRNSARGAIVKEIMEKKGLSLGEASKYVKEHNLY